MKILKSKKILKYTDKKILFISAITLLLIVFYINPLINTDISQWDRTFCEATTEGISISDRINNFYMLLLAIPILFTFLLFLNTLLLSHKEKYKDIFLKLSIISIVPIALEYISRFNNNGTINTNYFVTLMIFTLVMLYIIMFIDKKRIIPDRYIYILIITYVVGTQTLRILLNLNELDNFEIMICLTIIFALIIIWEKESNNTKKFIYNFLCFLTWLPTIIFITTEIIFSINEKNTFAANPNMIVYISLFLYLSLSLVVSFFYKNKEKSFKTFGYIGAIISLGLISYLPHTYNLEFNMINYSNLYELANRTVAADTLLNGKIPIIDNFSAHALSDVWTRIIYCIIYGDIKGILVDPYQGLVTIAGLIVLFYILKNVFDEHIAILITCFLPIVNTGFKNIGLCCLPIATMMYVLKNKSIKSYMLFWIITLINAFIVYDEGISIGIGTVLALIVLNICEKDWKNIAKYIITGIAVGIFTLLMYCFYCKINNIDMIGRAKEWISLSVGSNSTWATSTIGNPTKIDFLLSYFIIPITSVLIIISTIIQLYMKKGDKKLSLLIITLASTQLLYIPRTIVFHNIQECNGITGVLLNFTPWTISFFVLNQLQCNKKRPNMCLFGWCLTYGILIVLLSTIVIKIKPIDYNLINSSFQQSKNIDLRKNFRDMRTTKRITIEEKTQKFVDDYKNLFNEFLTKDETFLDNVNLTSLYMLTNRTRPFYVAQSPSLLTNLYTQECYLKEISEYKIPLALVGINDSGFLSDMQGVVHNVRYYKINEYIYNNYRPFIKMNDVAVWCKKDVYEKYIDKINSNDYLKEKYELIDYGYDKETLHKYNIKLIPYIWAKYDNFNAVKNKEILRLEYSGNNVFKIDNKKIIKNDKGNYLLFEATCLNDCKQKDITIKLKCSEDESIEYEYVITLVDGQNKYLLRISQDYYWNAKNIDKVIFENDSGELNYKINSVKILEGD